MILFSRRARIYFKHTTLGLLWLNQRVKSFFDARALHATFRWSDFIFVDSEPFQLFFSLFLINSGLEMFQKTWHEKGREKIEGVVSLKETMTRFIK